MPNTELQKHAVEIAQRLLASQIGILEGCRALLPKTSLKIAEVPQKPKKLHLTVAPELLSSSMDLAADGRSNLLMQHYGQGRPVYFATCIINLHSNLVVTLEELPLGITAVKFWSHKQHPRPATTQKKYRCRIPC
jgi:hypothetical protein